MTAIKTHVRKGDVVKVLSGVHRGAEGKILQVLPKKSQALIEGVRMIKKHERKSQDRPQGGIVEREGPIHISNLRLVEAGEKKGAKGAKGTKARKSSKKAE